MIQTTIKVAILEDHQSIIDGYVYRLREEPAIEIVATISYGEDLLPVLEQNQVNVLLLDIQVPTSPLDKHPYPILSMLDSLLTRFPDLEILVISMHTNGALIQAFIEAGVSGYILKDDHEAIQQLARIALMIANGGVISAKAPLIS